LKVPLAPQTLLRNLRWQEFGAFVFFGTINTVLTYGIYLFLVLFFTYGTAYTWSYIVGVFLSYYLNARFVFREKLRLMNALQYPVVYLLQYLIGLGLLYLLIDVVHLSKLLAPILVVLLTLPCTYLLSGYVIKARSRRSRRS
jgi:putative flippase GtrA